MLRSHTWENDFDLLEWMLLFCWLFMLTMLCGVGLWWAIKIIYTFVYSVYETLRITAAIL